LRAVGVVREDGSIDYSLILQAIALAARDEYLKQAILRFCVENFREDLKKMLGVIEQLRNDKTFMWDLKRLERIKELEKKIRAEEW